MQLDWIRAFLAVVDEGGFSPAAAHLFRSQGRVSSYIAALERELGAALFDRDRRPVRLTPAGAAFLDHARAMLDELETGRDAMASVQGLVRGDVALATYPSAGATFVPQVLSRFTAEHPGVHVELVERAVRGIDDALAGGDAMLAVRPLLPPARRLPAVRSAPLWREPMCLVVPDGHRLVGREAVTPAEFSDEQLVVSGQNLHHDTEAYRMLGGHGVEPRVRFVSDQPQTLVGLVRSGLAAGFTNLLALRTVLTDGVAVVPVPQLQRDVGVFWTPGLHTSPAASALLGVLVATAVPDGTEDRRQQHPESG